MSVDNQSSPLGQENIEISQAQTPVMDLTNLGNRSEKVMNILPPALLAAKLLNKRNSLGSVEVHLPVANYKVLCKPIASVDNAEIKTISGSMHIYNNALLKLFFDACVFPPEAGIETVDDFVSKICEADFKTINYGIIKSSFKTLETTSQICQNPKCTNPDESKIFTFQPMAADLEISFPKPPFQSPNHDFTKDLFVYDDDILTIRYKFDIIGQRYQELKKYSNAEIRENLISFGSLLPKELILPFFVDSVVIKGDDTIETQELTNAADIALFFKKLDTTSREIFESINDKYIDHVLSWQPIFSMRIECPHCKNKMDWGNIDIFVEFFRKFIAIY